MNYEELKEFAERHIASTLEQYPNITREELLYEMAINCALIWPPLKMATQILDRRMMAATNGTGFKPNE